MFPDQHGRLFNDVGSFRSVQLVVVSASERQVRLSCGATLTVVWVRPTTEPGCSQYRLHCRTAVRRCHHILLQTPWHGFHQQDCLLWLARLRLKKLAWTMATSIFLFVAFLLLASSPHPANTSPRLPSDFQHRSLNSVSDEVPLKEEGGSGSSVRQKTQLLLKPTEGCGPKLYFLVIVHSAPSHFRSSTVKKAWDSALVVTNVRSLQFLVMWLWSVFPTDFRLCDLSEFQGTRVDPGDLGVSVGSKRLAGHQSRFSPYAHFLPRSTNTKYTTPAKYTKLGEKKHKIHEIHRLALDSWRVNIAIVKNANRPPRLSEKSPVGWWNWLKLAISCSSLILLDHKTVKTILNLPDTTKQIPYIN